MNRLRPKSQHPSFEPVGSNLPHDPSEGHHTRRGFLRTASAAAFATAAGVQSAAGATRETTAPFQSETLVETLYGGLTEAQRGKVCFPFSDPLRLQINANWRVTRSSIGETFSREQVAMIKEIFMGMHSPEYADRVYRQVLDDNGKTGFEGSSVGIFGEPGSDEFEFVLTCRHTTRRCDGNSVAGTAFGGPIFYGHAPQFHEDPDHKGSAYWYQAVRANEVFQMLDPKQQEVALLENGRRERGTETVRLTGKTEGLDGIKVADLSPDQKENVRKVIRDILAPYREEDAAESMKLLEKNGFDNLHLAFYKNGDIGDDRVWDVWQIEGPAALLYFRGSPHIHAWVHIRESAEDDPFSTLPTRRKRKR